MTKKEDEFLGLSHENAKELIIDLNKQAEELKKKVVIATSKPEVDIEEFNMLNAKLANVREQMALICQSYNVTISEELHKESKRLNNLTIALIALTIVLGALATIDIISRVFFNV